MSETPPGLREAVYPAAVKESTGVRSYMKYGCRPMCWTEPYATMLLMCVMRYGRSKSTHAWCLQACNRLDYAFIKLWFRNELKVPAAFGIERLRINEY